MSQSAVESRVESCQGLVRSIAVAIHRKLKGTFELDDLISYGQVGLAQAANEFDDTKGTLFSTYSYYRIRGAIYDGVGKMGWQKTINRRDAKWNEVLAENAERPAEPSQDSAAWLEAISRRMATSAVLSYSNEDADIEVADDSVFQPVNQICGNELRARLQQLIDELPAETASLIRQIYFSEQTMVEAATQIGVSKSWASRLHAKGLQQLADRLHQLGYES